MTRSRLGLKLKGADAKEFWKDENNPHVTKEQIEMFKDARCIYKEHPFWGGIKYDENK